MSIKSASEVRQEFDDFGVSISEWSRINGFSAPLVYEVLRGRPAVRGQSHEIAVALGMKKGRRGGIQSLQESLERLLENHL